MAQRKTRILLAVALTGLLHHVALADEIVHFTNGAEMPVRSHSVEKEMVKLDLGNSSFIAFPMSMVDRIVSSGQDVYLNPTFHPSNQAVAGGATAARDGSSRGGASSLTDNVIHGTAASVGYAPQPNGRGGAGMMLGESADQIPQSTHGDPNAMNTDVSRRRIYNPAMPQQPGSMPQVIMPPGMKAPGRMSVAGPPRTQTPHNPEPAPAGNPDGQPQGDPTPQSPVDNN